MMFAHNFVLAVKVDGKILREEQNLVTLPFGSEYTLLFKNLNSRRAQVRVDVNGVDATDGGRLVVMPNETLELERFIRNGNLSGGNRFKFIERSAEVEAHRGIQADDGLVRAEFWIEKEVVERPRIEYYGREPLLPPEPRYPKWPKEPWYKGPQASSRPSRRGFSATATRSLRSEPTRGGVSGQSVSSHSMRSFVDVGEASASCSTAGITVAGSASSQQFHHVSGFPLELQSHVIVLQLRGEIAGKVVSAPVTVNQKLKCETCGKKSKAGSGFCAGCGAALTLI